MKISKPKIFNSDNKTSYSVQVDGYVGKEQLWYTVDEAYADFVSDSSDAALLALLIPAMERGEDIYIEGVLSEKLYHHANKSLQVLLCHVMPFLKRIKIYVATLYREVKANNRGVATGFSGGIDSFCTLKDYYYDADISEGFKITHLVFNNVGSHYLGEKVFRERYERLVPIVEKIGLPFLMVNSNLDCFYSDRTNFILTHTLRNTSVSLLLQRGISTFLYSSAYNYLDVYVGPSDAVAYVDAITLPLMSTENLHAMSVGSEYSRVDKTLRVSEVKDSYDSIDVCVYEDYKTGYTNCTVCWKCLRTLSTLEIAHKHELYKSSFNLALYDKQKTLHYAKVLVSKEPLLVEIKKYACERKFRIPFLSYVIAYSGVLKIARWYRALKG